MAEETPEKALCRRTENFQAAQQYSHTNKLSYDAFSFLSSHSLLKNERRRTFRPFYNEEEQQQRVASREAERRLAVCVGGNKGAAARSFPDFLHPVVATSPRDPVDRGALSPGDGGRQIGRRTHKQRRTERFTMGSIHTHLASGGRYRGRGWGGGPERRGELKQRPSPAANPANNGTPVRPES